MQMQYVTINGGSATISVDGEYTLLCTLQVMSELKAAEQQGCTDIVVDFDKTTDIDSSAIRDLARVYRMYNAEGSFKCKNAKGRVLAMLKASKLDELWLK